MDKYEIKKCEYKSDGTAYVEFDKYEKLHKAYKQQAEQITALKEKNCELAHKIGHLTDDINEQERHTEETQQENQRLKELLDEASHHLAGSGRVVDLMQEIKQALAAQPQGGE